MSDLVSPAVSPVALPPKAAPPSVLAPGVPSLAVFVDLMIGKLAPPTAKATPGGGERHDDAESGKILPDDDKKTPVDPALMWLFGSTPIPAPQPVTVALPATPPVTTMAVPAELPAVVAAMPDAQQPTAEPDILAPKPVAFAPPQESKPVVQPAIVTPVINQPMPLAITPQPVALPALFALAMTRDHEMRDGDAAFSPTPAVSALQTSAVSVAPAGDAQRQSLDLGRQDWPQKMIDHIEALRDNANANDTSIRLKPEALGQVDVSLKTHNDGAISVRFTADQPTTRTLLADAAPQFAAAAEARGIRLSGTSVDLGGQGDQRPRPNADQPQNISNHLAAPRGDDSQAVDDGRIA